MKIRAIIWDLGGVILRTENPQPREILARELHLTREELEYLVFASPTGIEAQLGKIPPGELWRFVLEEVGLPLANKDHFQERFWGGDILDRELVKYIRELREQYKTGILSNAWSDLRHMLTEVWKISDAFDHITISAELGIMKPDPEIYRHAVEGLNVKPQQAVFIDDFTRNVEAAKAFGMHAIHFKNREQALNDFRELLAKSN